MLSNDGGYDRIARIVGGIALLGLGWRLRRSGGGRLRRIAGGSLLTTGVQLLATGIFQRSPSDASEGVDTTGQRLSEAIGTVTERLTGGDDADGGRIGIPTRS